jgi:hypothetical protein
MSSVFRRTSFVVEAFHGQNASVALERMHQQIKDRPVSWSIGSVDRTKTTPTSIENKR